MQDRCKNAVYIVVVDKKEEIPRSRLFVSIAVSIGGYKIQRYPFIIIFVVKMNK